MTRVEVSGKIDLILLLLRRYTSAIKQATKLRDNRAVKRYLHHIEMDYGICRYIQHRVVDGHIIVNNSDIWIRKYKKSMAHGGPYPGSYWAKVPWFCETKRESINALQIRVDILKQELKPQ